MTMIDNRPSTKKLSKWFKKYSDKIICSILISFANFVTALLSAKILALFAIDINIHQWLFVAVWVLLNSTFNIIFLIKLNNDV